MPTVQQNIPKHEAIQWTAESEINAFDFLVAADAAGIIPFSNWTKDDAGNLCNADGLSVWAPVGTWFVSQPYWDTFPGWVVIDPVTGPQLNQMYQSMDVVGDDTAQFSIIP